MPTSTAALLEVYATVVPPQSATYCSTPVTSGVLYFDWLERRGGRYVDVDEIAGPEREAHTVEVVRRNRLRSQDLVASLRRRKPYVIDPGAIPHLPGWSQGDWLAFWEQVIEKYAAEVVFGEGWEYSNGCAHEFWFASSRRLPTYDGQMRPLSVSRGRAAVQAAHERMAARGAPVSRLEAVLANLAKLERELPI